MAVKDIVDRGKAMILSMRAEREPESSPRPRVGGEKFGLADAPLPGDPAVPEFFGRLYEMARDEVQRLGLEEGQAVRLVPSRLRVFERNAASSGASQAPNWVI